MQFHGTQDQADFHRRNPLVHGAQCHATQRQVVHFKAKTLAIRQFAAADVRIQHGRFDAEILAPLHVEEHRWKFRFERRMPFENDFTRRAGGEFDAHAVGARVEHQVFRAQHGLVLLGDATPIEDKGMRCRIHVEQARDDLPRAVIDGQEVGSINEVA